MQSFWKHILPLIVVTGVCSYQEQYILSSEPTHAMATKFDQDEILETPDIYGVSNRLSALALEFAILGQLDTARDLVSLLNVHNPCYHRRYEYLDPLWFAWEITSWPSGEKERVKEPLDDIAKDTSRSSWLESHKWEPLQTKARYVPDEDQTYDMEGLRKLSERLQVLKGKKDADMDMDMDMSLVLAKMLEVALTVNGKNNSDMEKLIKDLLSDIAKRLHSPYQMKYLAQVRNAWPLLKIGLLASAAGIDNEKEEEVGRLVLKTFKQRLENGLPKSSTWEKSIEELLRIISENTVVNEGAHGFYREMGTDRPTSLLHDLFPGRKSPTLRRDSESHFLKTIKTSYPSVMGLKAHGMALAWIRLCSKHLGSTGLKKKSGISRTSHLIS